ncbi:hypothetical protein ACWD7F_36850 [Streptomyces sp. NPDC005122]
MMPVNGEGAWPERAEDVERSEGAEGTDLVRVRKPSKAAVGLFGLTTLVAAQSAGVVPQGQATGTALFTAALIVLGRHCLYRR